MTMHPTTIRTHLTRILAAQTSPRDRDAIEQAIAYIDHAHNPAHPLGRSLATLLDAALPMLGSAARREARAEADKPLRCITWKLRHEAAVKAVARATDTFGYEP